MLDCARFRRRDLENSLTAYNECLAIVGQMSKCASRHPSWNLRCLNVHLIVSYKFVPVLVHSEMDSSKRAPADLLLDTVLVDSMNSASIILTVGVL